jgi:hypothetical protein
VRYLNRTYRLPPTIGTLATSSLSINLSTCGLIPDTESQFPLHRSPKFYILRPFYGPQTAEDKDMLMTITIARRLETGAAVVERLVSKAFFFHGCSVLPMAQSTTR